MKSLVIEQVNNGFLVSEQAHRYFGDCGPQPTSLYVYRTIEELQKDLPRIFEAITDSPKPHVHEP